jgi:hypothetical protein
VIRLGRHLVKRVGNLTNRGGSIPVLAAVLVAMVVCWSQTALVWSQSIPAVRFSFYAYRTLAVPCPEVYLLADALTSEVLETLPGTRAAYHHQDVRDLDFYQRVARREATSPSFRWSQWLLSPDSVSDIGTASRGKKRWSPLDARLPSAAVLLRSASIMTGTIEDVATRYTQMRRLGRPFDRLFVVVDKGGHGYLVADTLLYRGGVAMHLVGAWPRLEPLLVFNEHSVYYPLLGRDDRAGDTVLARIVGQLGGGEVLTGKSKGDARLAALAEAAALPDPRSRQLAVLIASGLVDLGQPPIRAAWAEYVGSDDSLTLGCATAMTLDAMFWANRLSPRAATMARTLERDSLGAGLEKLQNEYLDACGRRVSPNDSTDKRVEAWGNLWSYGLLLIGLDDIARTRAGSGASQGLAMSATLNLAGVPHFGLFAKGEKGQIPDQMWLMAQHGRYQFNFGSWRPVPSDLGSALQRYPLLISGYSRPGYAITYLGDTFCGAANLLSLSADLTFITQEMPVVSFQLWKAEGRALPLQTLLTNVGSAPPGCSAKAWPVHESEVNSSQ